MFIYLNLKEIKFHKKLKFLLIYCFKFTYAFFNSASNQNMLFLNANIPQVVPIYSSSLA